LYQSAVLLGRDHIELGEITVVEITPDLAIGISRGRFPKGYQHTDPNEDAVLAATDGETTVLAVADGHNGLAASHAAIEAIASTTETSLALTGGLLERLVNTLLAVVCDLDNGVSRTALTVCVTNDRGFEAATFGDSGVIISGNRRSEMYQGKTAFLGGPDTKPERLHIERISHPIVAAVTDGVFSFLPQSKPKFFHQQPDESLSHLCEHLIQLAFSGGAGDNIAVAVHRSESTRHQYLGFDRVRIDRGGNLHAAENEQLVGRGWDSGPTARFRP